MSSVKSNIIVILLSLIIFISCTKQTGWKDYRLKGKVKSYTERYYEPIWQFKQWENGKLKGNEHITVSFNQKGDYTEKEFFDENLNLTTKRVPVYKNKEIIETYDYDANGKLMWYRKYNQTSSEKIEIQIYDKDGKILGDAVVHYLNGKENLYIVHPYDATDDFKEITYFYSYDDADNLINYKQTNRKGEIISNEKYEYLKFDEKGNWLRKLVYTGNSDNHPYSIVIREYEYF